MTRMAATVTSTIILLSIYRNKYNLFPRSDQDSNVRSVLDNLPNQFIDLFVETGNAVRVSADLRGAASEFFAQRRF